MGDFAVVGSTGGAMVVTTGAAVVTDPRGPGKTDWNVHLVRRRIRNQDRGQTERRDLSERRRPERATTTSVAL